jgi:nudix-type nucleoside diphosphatase (YffH/AdpP family)
VSADRLPPTSLPILKVADRKLVHDGFVKFEVVGMETIIQGERKRLVREVHDHGDGAAVLAYDPVARTAVLVRQRRVGPVASGSDGLLVEAIAGIVDDEDGDPAETARREAMEEAGLELTAMEPVGKPYSSPGTVTERVHLFLGEIAPHATRGSGGGVASEHEQIEVLELPLDLLAELADTGGLEDMKTLLLVETLRRRRPDLFGSHS